MEHSSYVMQRLRKQMTELEWNAVNRSIERADAYALGWQDGARVPRDFSSAFTFRHDYGLLTVSLVVDKSGIMLPLEAAHRKFRAGVSLRDGRYR